LIQEAGNRLPLVSVVLTTRDRPRFLSTALACYQHQTYPNRELVVVDDGDENPADAAQVASAGGRLLRAEPGTPLGSKLNAGIEASRGSLCQKMDDDDWYAPAFLASMVEAFMASWKVVCHPTVAFLTPFLFFDIARWEVRQSIDNNVPGATLLFARSGWEERPFRSLRGDEDLWFVLDHMGLGASLVPCRALETFLAVRHGNSGRDRSHTWLRQATGQSLEEYLTDRPLHDGGPERLLPVWALERYRAIRHDLVPSINTG